MSARVVVVGGGAAGLAAALAAAREGARVTLLERGDRVGGTTALSGGVAWLPANHRAAEAGVADSRERALAYLRGLALGDTDAELVETFVDDARRVAEELERLSPLRFELVRYPDYHAEREGGLESGRSLEPVAVEVDQEAAALVRSAPNIHAPVTYNELVEGSIDREEVRRRVERGVLTMGRALVGTLLAGALRAEVEVHAGVRARALVLDSGRVVGIQTDRGLVEGSVVLASGGFERDERLVRAFLRGPMLAPAGVPTCEGDGLRMALAAGAALGSMSEAWWCPAYRVPGEEIDGLPFYRPVLTERARPHSLIVDGRGRRFFDEAQNYNDSGRALHDFDPAEFTFPRIPSWLVFDAEYRRRYRLGPLSVRDPDPGWLARGDDLEALGAALGVSLSALAETVERFNTFAEQGRDDDFGRGSYPYDRHVGDAASEHPTLGAVRTPPFYALRVLPGCLGTKGGPRTDAFGRVLRADGGGVIEGLYAAGNAAASPFGLAYPGAGGTVGPALVFGMRAGETAARG